MMMVMMMMMMIIIVNDDDDDCDNNDDNEDDNNVNDYSNDGDYNDDNEDADDPLPFTKFRPKIYRIYGSLPLSMCAEGVRRGEGGENVNLTTINFHFGQSGGASRRRVCYQQGYPV